MPTSKCFVKGCLNGRQNGVHYLPRNLDFRNRWFQALGYVTFSNQEFLCNDHFADDDFISLSFQQKRLKKAAIPSRNLFFDNNSVADDNGNRNQSETSCLAYSNCDFDRETGESLRETRKRSVDFDTDDLIVPSKRRHIDIDLLQKAHNIRPSFVAVQPDLLNVLDLPKAKVNFERISFYFESVFKKMEIARMALKIKSRRITPVQDKVKTEVARERLCRKAKPSFFVESSDDDDDDDDNNKGLRDSDDDYHLPAIDIESKRSKVISNNSSKKDKYVDDEDFIPKSSIENRRKIRRSLKRSVISDDINIEDSVDLNKSSEVEKDFMFFNGVEYGIIVKNKVQMSKWDEERYQHCEVISLEDNNFREAHAIFKQDAEVDALSLLDFEEGFVTHKERDWLLTDVLPIGVVLACRFCTRATRCFRTMQHHLITAHLGMRDCKCLHCGKGYSRLSSLLLHYWQNHPTIGIGFRASANYIVVQDNSTCGDMTRKIFKCPYCNFLSNRINNTRNHVSLCMRLWQTRSCPICHVQLPAFETQVSSYDDGQLGRKASLLSSNGINITSSNISSLVDHLKIHNNDKLSLVNNKDICSKFSGIICHICNAESDVPLASLFLELHLALHKNDVRVRCGECLLQLPRNWAQLHLHYQLTHPEINERCFIDANVFAYKCANKNGIFSCPYCGLVGDCKQVKACSEVGNFVRPLPPVAATAHCTACNMGAADNLPVSFFNNITENGGLIKHIQLKHKFCILCLRLTSKRDMASALTSAKCCPACDNLNPYASASKISSKKKILIDKRILCGQELALETASSIKSFISRGLPSIADDAAFLLCRCCSDKKGVLPAMLPCDDVLNMANHLCRDDSVDVNLRCIDCSFDTPPNKDIFKNTSTLRKHYGICHPKKRKSPSIQALLISQLTEQNYVEKLTYKEVERRRQSISCNYKLQSFSENYGHILNGGSKQLTQSVGVLDSENTITQSSSRHNNKESTGNKFVCVKCGRKCTTWQNMRFHNRQEPCATNVRFICPLQRIHQCPEFKTENSYRDHMAFHSKQDILEFVKTLPVTLTFRCMVCLAFDTLDLRLFFTHLEEHFIVQPYLNCLFCPFMKCCGIQSFNIHAREVHPEFSEEMQSGKLGFYILNQHRVLLRLRPVKENVVQTLCAIVQEDQESSAIAQPQSLDFAEDDMLSPVALQEVLVEFDCSMCLKVQDCSNKLDALQSAAAALNHYRFKHPEYDLRYVCQICRAASKNSEAQEGFFQSIQQLHSHVWAKHGQKDCTISKTASFLCLNRSRCARHLQNIEGLLAHVSQFHSKGQDTVLFYYCPMCPWLQASHVQYIISHQRVEHHEIAPLMKLGFSEPLLHNEAALFQRRFSSEKVSSEVAALVPDRYLNAYRKERLNDSKKCSKRRKKSKQQIPQTEEGNPLRIQKTKSKKKMLTNCEGVKEPGCRTVTNELEPQCEQEAQCRKYSECGTEVNQVIHQSLSASSIQDSASLPQPIFEEIQNPSVNDAIVLEFIEPLNPGLTCINNSISVVTQQDSESNNSMLDLIIKELVTEKIIPILSDETILSKSSAVSSSMPMKSKEFGSQSVKDFHVGPPLRLKNKSCNDVIVPVASGPLMFLENCWTHQALPVFEHRLLTDSCSEAILIDSFSAFNVQYVRDPQQNSSVSLTSSKVPFTSTLSQMNQPGSGSRTPQTQLSLQQKPSSSNASYSSSSHMRFTAVNSFGGIISGSSGLPSLQTPTSLYLSSSSTQSPQSTRFCQPSHFQSQLNHQVAQNFPCAPAQQISHQDECTQLQAQLSQYSQPQQYSVSLNNTPAVRSSYMTSTNVDAMLISKFQQQQDLHLRGLINTTASHSTSNYQHQDVRDVWFPQVNSLGSFNSILEQVQPPPFYHVVGTTASVIHRK